MMPNVRTYADISTCACYPWHQNCFENVFEHDTTRPTGHMYSTHIFYVQTLLSMFSAIGSKCCKNSSKIRRKKRYVPSEFCPPTSEWECEECSVDRPVGFAVLRLLTSWISLIMMCISHAKDPSSWINKVLLLAQKAQDYPSWMGQVSKNLHGFSIFGRWNS